MPKDSPTGPVARLANAMSVDVEEHFQVSAMEGAIARDDWPKLASRVVANTEWILDTFARKDVRATFFTLGVVAEQHPALVRRIVAEGHELASHGYAHWRVTQQRPEDFRADVRRTKALLEDIGGVAVHGYRAASFSMTPETAWAHGILEEEGYTYSSSIYPIHHDHYGIPDAPRFPYYPNGGTHFQEIPITTVAYGGRRLPCGGGGYFRLLPYALSAAWMRRVNRKDSAPCVFYFHPWEVDPAQPRVPGLTRRTRFRHYVGLRRMAPRLERLSAAFSWDRMDRVFATGPAPETATPPTTPETVP